MHIANCWLKMSKFGSNILLRGVTPAEVAMLRKAHELNAGGDPISDVVVYGKVNRRNQNELVRLRQKYRNLSISDGTNKKTSVFETLFGGLNSRVPQNFEDIGVKYTIGKNEPPKNSPDVQLTQEETERLDELVEDAVVEETVEAL
jgi:hypothetical protein